MAIECGDLWSLAKTLASLAQNENVAPQMQEPLARASISRAYYAGYHRALQYAVPQGHVPPGPGGGSGHSALWRWYRQQGGTLRMIASLGFAAHDRRKMADYDLGAECPSLADQLEDVDMLADSLKPLEQAATGASSILPDLEAPR